MFSSFKTVKYWYDFACLYSAVATLFLFSNVRLDVGPVPVKKNQFPFGFAFSTMRTRARSKLDRFCFNFHISVTLRCDILELSPDWKTKVWTIILVWKMWNHFVIRPIFSRFCKKWKKIVYLEFSCYDIAHRSKYVFLNLKTMQKIWTN